METDRQSALVDFFRNEAPAWGNHGDHEGWSTEETAIHFLREHQALGLAQTADWNAVTGLIRHKMEMELARHPAVGAALTFKDGEKLISDLSSSLTYDIHRKIDPTYDAQPENS